MDAWTRGVTHPGTRTETERSSLFLFVDKVLCMVGMLLLLICLKSSVWSSPLYGRYASLGSKNSSITVKAKKILEKVRVHGNSRSPPPCELGHPGN